MLSRNNWKEQVRQQKPKKQRFTIKKLTIGVASVLIGFTFMGMSASADAQTTSATGTQTGIASATDTTTPIAPSTTVPSYDGTKVVDTPFYNNPQGTNSKLIDNKSKDGQYNIYFTAKDASGKEYASSYAVEKSNAPIHSLLDKDAGAYDPNSLELHFYYQNNGDQDQTINYTLRMPDWLNPYKPKGTESSLVPDSSRINDVKVTSKQGNTYDISSVTKTLDGVESRDGDLRRVKDVPVNLTVKANDAINLVIPFVLNTTAKESTGRIDDNNDFYVLENGQQTGHLNVRSSTYAPLYPEDKIYPRVKVGNHTYTDEYPDNPGAFTWDLSVFRDEDFLNGYPDGIYEASTPTNKSTVYGSYTFSYLSLNKYEDYLTKNGFTVAFSNSNGKPMPYYRYTLSVSGAKLVDRNGNPVQDETKGHPYKGRRYFEVVPVILLNQDETYTTKTAPTAWDPSTMVNKVADPTNYRYWDQKTDSAVRRDNTAAQLTAKDFTVTITKDGQAVKPDANGKYDLSKPGTYTVTYSRDFNGTTISNSGQITVTPVEDTTVTYTFYDETDKKPVEGHDVTVTGQPGTDQKVNLTTPEGYKLAEGQTLPTSVTIPNANETITIHLVHATKDIKPNDPGVNPSNPVYADMFKTVTRTIKVNNPDRMVDTTTQQVNFNRTKTIDEVTDEVISYGNWTLATGSAKDWGQFNVPQLDGFISYVDGNAAKKVAEENVTADTADVTVEVTYKNSGNNGNNTTPDDDGNHNTNPGDNGNHNTNPGNNNDINNGTQNGNNNGINNGTQNGNGNKTVNTNVTDNGNGDNSQNNKQALPQTGNTKNDAAVAGLGLAGLLAMLGLGGLKKKRN
ncbi:YSIRK-type signal peptide-containing protein [Limosilactobacillus oris]|uniref:mucin-binding protein n=1 Tax=Limosilactobacillus oris TaxID=1632 RepID=UPI0021B1ECEA|nr:YSIRK-type signal peptide-containing protein [Limosilactobacillus oris]UXC66806.1 YSIRK-type signal peptide-containing protein [Limosilactobacillus oris]